MQNFSTEYALGKLQETCRNICTGKDGLDAFESILVKKLTEILKSGSYNYEQITGLFMNTGRGANQPILEDVIAVLEHHKADLKELEEEIVRVARLQITLPVLPVPVDKIAELDDKNGELEQSMDVSSNLQPLRMEDQNKENAAKKVAPVPEPENKNLKRAIKTSESPEIEEKKTKRNQDASSSSEAVPSKALVKVTKVHAEFLRRLLHQNAHKWELLRYSAQFGYKIEDPIINFTAIDASKIPTEAYPIVVVGSPKQDVIKKVSTIQVEKLRKKLLRGIDQTKMIRKLAFSAAKDKKIEPTKEKPVKRKATQMIKESTPSLKFKVKIDREELERIKSEQIVDGIKNGEMNVSIKFDGVVLPRPANKASKDSEPNMKPVAAPAQSSEELQEEENEEKENEIKKQKKQSDEDDCNFNFPKRVLF